MAYYIITSTRYTDLEIGIFKDDICLEKEIILNKEASKLLVCTLDKMLNKCNLKLNDLNFIGATQGPAPYTSLRANLATINGIAFAKKLPLIGLSTIEILLGQYSFEHSSKILTVAIFNAFGKDVYYGIARNQNLKSLGSIGAEDLFKTLPDAFPNKVFKFIGPAVNLFKTKIEEILKDKARFSDLESSYPTLEMLAQKALTDFNNSQDLLKDKSSFIQIMPLYFKPSVGEARNCLLTE